jgi:hypothetical protein
VKHKQNKPAAILKGKIINIMKTTTTLKVIRIERKVCFAVESWFALLTAAK